MQAHAHLTRRIPTRATACVSCLDHKMVMMVRTSFELLMLLTAIFIDEVIILEYLAVAHIYLLYLLAVDATQLEQDTAHCLLFVYHTECV